MEIQIMKKNRERRRELDKKHWVDYKLEIIYHK